MNNKGFAITSVLYGLLIVLLLIIMGSLTTLSNQKKIMEELIDGDKGAREIVNEIIELDDSQFTEINGELSYTTSKTALYVYNNCKKYYSAGKTITINGICDNN